MVSNAPSPTNSARTYTQDTYADKSIENNNRHPSDDENIDTTGGEQREQQLAETTTRTTNISRPEEIDEQQPTKKSALLQRRKKSLSPQKRPSRSKSPVRSSQRNKNNPWNQTTASLSHLSPDRLYQREWKQQRREMEKKQEDERIRKENEYKFLRLAKINHEPSTYPSLFPQQEQIRERHARDHRQKVQKQYIPILKDNLFIVERLANVKGNIDVKKMEQDYVKHTNLFQKKKQITLPKI